MKPVKTLVSFITIFALLLAPMAYGDCDFKTGITPGPNKTFIYTEACHLKVGTLVQDNAVKTQQVSDLNKAITLKDLAIQDEKKRGDDWMNTSGVIEGRLQKVDSLEKTNNTIYYGLGVVSMFLATWAASKVIHR